MEKPSPQIKSISTEILIIGSIELDHKECIRVDRFQRTSVEGVFAAGDVTCGGLQVISAAGEGCVAAL